MATKPKAPFQVGGYKVKWSLSNKTWQIWKGSKLIDDFTTKESAKTKAERLTRGSY